MESNNCAMFYLDPRKPIGEPKRLSTKDLKYWQLTKIAIKIWTCKSYMNSHGKAREKKRRSISSHRHLQPWNGLISTQLSENWRKWKGCPRRRHSKSRKSYIKLNQHSDGWLVSNLYSRMDFQLPCSRPKVQRNNQNRWKSSLQIRQSLTLKWNTMSSRTETSTFTDSSSKALNRMGEMMASVDGEEVEQSKRFSTWNSATSEIERTQCPLVSARPSLASKSTPNRMTTTFHDSASSCGETAQASALKMMKGAQEPGKQVESTSYSTFGSSFSQSFLFYLPPISSGSIWTHSLRTRLGSHLVKLLGLITSSIVLNGTGFTSMFWEA